MPGQGRVATRGNRDLRTRKVARNSWRPMSKHVEPKVLPSGSTSSPVKWSGRKSVTPLCTNEYYEVRTYQCSGIILNHQVLTCVFSLYPFF